MIWFAQPFNKQRVHGGAANVHHLGQLKQELLPAGAKSARLLFRPKRRQHVYDRITVQKFRSMARGSVTCEWLQWGCRRCAIEYGRKAGQSGWREGGVWRRETWQWDSEHFSEIQQSSKDRNTQLNKQKANLLNLILGCAFKRRQFYRAREIGERRVVASAIEQMSQFTE